MGTELKDTFVQAYNDTYDYINRYLTSKLPTRELIEDALQSVYLDYYRLSVLCPTYHTYCTPISYRKRLSILYIISYEIATP